MNAPTPDAEVVRLLAETADRHNFVVDDGGPGECSWRCACGQRGPRFVAIEKAGDDAKAHVALAQALVLADRLAQAQAPTDASHVEPLTEFLAGLRGYIPPTRQGESFDVCDVCRDIECGGACPNALLVVRQVIEALDNDDDREYLRDEFREEGLPLTQAPTDAREALALLDDLIESGLNAAAVGNVLGRQVVTVHYLLDVLAPIRAALSPATPQTPTTQEHTP